MHSSLNHTAHRPWPLPAKPWKWRQSWRHLAFIHYRINATALRAGLPPDLEIEEFDGSAWVAIVPFLMVDVMRGSLPSFPPMDRFPELNVRTYVRHNGRPGVWFFSLDADCWPIVLGGRFCYGLPFYKSRMTHTERGGVIEYVSSRRGCGARFHASYRPCGPVFYPPMSSFEHWIAERYCLYSHAKGKGLRLDIHHRPWPLQKAEVSIHRSDLFAAAGLSVGAEAAVCHFSSGVEVVSYEPAQLDDN